MCCVGEVGLDADGEMCRCACACRVRGCRVCVCRAGVRQREARETLALLKVLPGDVAVDILEATL